jgi:DNA repair protein RecO (recombination protein O)
MPAYKANAIVLRRIPLGETDKILTLYTRELGKLSAIAKGARRTTSRLAGATEPLMLIRALLGEGMNLDVVSQTEIRESFPTLRGDFGLFLRATYCCELLDKLTEERHPDTRTFDLLLSTLFILQRAEQPDTAVHAYELQLMAEAGYEPRLDECARCERRFGDENGILESAYSPSRGGVLCDQCVAQMREDVLPLSPQTAQSLRQLAREEDARTLAATVLPDDVVDQINRALRFHLRYRLERDLKSTAFLDAYRVGAMDITVDAGPT